MTGVREVKDRESGENVPANVMKRILRSCVSPSCRMSELYQHRRHERKDKCHRIQGKQDAPDEVFQKHLS